MTDKKSGIVFAMILVLAVFLLISFFLFAERLGVVVSDIDYSDPFLDDEKLVLKEDALELMPKTCMLLTDLGREDCLAAYEDCFAPMILDMKVPADVVDLGYMPIPGDLDVYDTIFLATPDVSVIFDRLTDIFSWVENGGRMMISMCVDTDDYGKLLLQKAGVVTYSDYSMLSSIYFDDNFLIGGGRSYDVPDPFDSSIAVVLRESTEVYAWNGRRGGLPVIWSNSYGEGKFVVVNTGIYEKSSRGIYSMAYSLLEDVCVYPVLNGAIVFLDDMPSPVPEGDSEYIQRDFNTTIADYYVNYWFPDIEKLSETYGLPLVGLCIENYGKDVNGVTDRQKETSRFTFFGNQILRNGGEIGYHGYNHQPLCLDNVDYGDKYDYNTWQDVDSINKSFGELIDFTKTLYPDANISCYVPPSNILSEEGREYIGSLYPAVKTISGSYFPEDGNDYVYVSEFEVCDDCIVNLPRITSGSLIDSFITLSALSELNYHYVFSHFIHPDDAMDEDRGAAKGWRTLYNDLSGFLGWVFEIAPDIRRVDSATLSGTIQRWSALTADKEYEYSENATTLTVTLGNYIDEAFLFVRFNEGYPDDVSGGTLVRLTDSLYLLTAESSEIVFKWER